MAKCVVSSEDQLNVEQDRSNRSETRTIQKGNTRDKDRWRTEELQALYVLGLIAVLATMKFAAGNSYLVPFGTIQINIIPLVDVILIFWGLYAFLMALGFSLGESLRAFMIPLSQVFLLFGFFLAFAVAIFTFLLGLSPVSYYIAVLALIYLVGKSLVYVLKTHGKIAGAIELKSRITWEFLAKVGGFLSLFVLVICARASFLNQYLAFAITALGIYCVLYLAYKELGDVRRTQEKQ
mgnify:CR=1 FL=1